MNRNLKTAATLAAMGAAALLSGCAANNLHIAGNSPLRNTAFVQKEFKGHAFVLGTVTAASSQMQSTADHTLPTKAYLELLRYDLEKAFKNAGLNNGTLPAYRVDVEVDQFYFKSGVGGFHVGHLYATDTITGGTSTIHIPIKLWDGGGYIYGYWHAPVWDYCRRMIPLTAIYTDKAILRLKNGERITSGSLGTTGDVAGQHIDLYNLGKFGIKELTKSEIEKVTGYSAQQLHAFDKSSGA